MPRLPIDYSKTIIYKIVCNDLNICDVYVGSTTDFIRRKGRHKSDCNNEKSKAYNFKVYQTIRANGGWDNFTMIEIEKYNCNDSNEAHAKERYHYELLNSSLNSNLPNRTQREYYEANKLKIVEYNKKYKEANKEKLKEKAKQCREVNKEIIAERTKKYREANKEKLKEKAKQYREKMKKKTDSIDVITC
jgi:arsenate reductase-like glutaredoxin family protein